MKRFLIVGCARSGTTVTDLAVSGHPQAGGVNDEVSASAFFGKGLSAFTFGHEPEKERENAFPFLFDAIAGFNKKDSTEAIGFKTAIHTASEAHNVFHVVRNHLPDLHVVFVYRRDLVAQHASLLRAARSGQWHSWNKAKENTSKIEVDRSKFSHYVLSCREINRTLRELSATTPFHTVCYEDDICTDFAAACRKIFSFLGLHDLTPEWVNSKKVAPDPESYIEDYSELKKLQARLEDGMAPLAPGLKARLRMAKHNTHEFLRRIVG